MRVTDLVLRDVEIAGRLVDCRVTDGVIAELGPDLRGRGAQVVDGAGGALLPGLADHHLHLLALAAAASSIDISGVVRWQAMLREASRDGDWIRAVGWDDQLHGQLDRDRLDAVVPDRPVRVQHRSGALWALNSKALDRVLTDSPAPAEAERDDDGRLTGRLWRGDDWLRGRTGAAPNLRDVGVRLARLGVTAVTDATPDLDAKGLAHIAAAVADGDLPQRVLLMSGALPEQTHQRISLGPRKLLVSDHDLPSPDALAGQIAAAHADGRPVAVHCVSYAALALTIAALQTAGSRRGDRVEHCAMADPSAVALVAALGVAVVTQPTLPARRGDDYLDRHPCEEHADLWRYASLLEAGVPTVASSDAPYGDLDPWATLRAARDRTTPGGRVLGAVERVAPATVLAGLLTRLDDPGGAQRAVTPGAPADLVLLRVSLFEALAAPDAELVAATLIEGRIVAGDEVVRA